MLALKKTLFAGGHGVFETFAARGIAGKHIEAGKGRAENHGLSCLGRCQRLLNSLFHATASLAIYAFGRKQITQLGPGFSQKHGCVHTGSCLAGKIGQVAPLGLAPAYPDDLPTKAGEGGQRGVSIRGLGIVPEGDPFDLSYLAQAVARRSEVPRGLFECFHGEVFVRCGPIARAEPSGGCAESGRTVRA